MNWSEFSDAYAKKLTTHEGSWAEVLNRLRTVGTFASKAKCPWIKLASFGDLRASGGSLRNNANVQVIYGLEGDYDAGQIRLDDAISRLEKAGIRALVYTSPSHTPDRPRWRVLAPLNKPALPEQRGKLLARLNGALNGVLAPESFTLSQSYYYGQVDGSPEYRVLVTFDDPEDGSCIDDLHELDAIAIGRNSAGNIDATPLLSDISDPADVFGHRVGQLGRRLKTGDGRREMLKSYVASRSARGIRGQDLMTLVNGICATYFDPADPIDEKDISDIANWAQFRDVRSAQDAERIVASLMPKPVVDPETGEIQPLLKPEPAETAPGFPLEFPPGVAGQIADYILASSRMPVRAFAVAGALQALSYLNGNSRWVGPSETALNLYQVLVAPTGRGKEDPRKGIKRILDQSLLAALGICEGLSSGPALLRTLEASPQALVMTDEFGLFLQVALTDKGSSHLKELVKELMSLYGLGRSSFAGKKYAVSAANIGRIDLPYVNLLGTTTPLELVDGITTKSVDNGFLNRILFVPSAEDAVVNRAPVTAVPAALAEAVAMVTHAPPGGMVYEVGAHDLMVQLADSMGEPGEYENLWRRAEEQLIRVAGVIAIGDGGEIRCAHVVWAHRYVQWCISSFAGFLGRDLAETVFEKRISRAADLIRNAHKYAGDTQFGSICATGHMPRGKLLKLLKVTARELDEVIRFLVDSRQVLTGTFEGFQILWQAPIL